MHIHNTLSRKKEIFKPLSDREIKVYFCGPTPYNFAHIGNLKTYVGNDIVVRTLKFLGYNVATTMNITDIDDKTIRESQKAGVCLVDFTQKYTNAFLEDIQKLGILQADNIAPISGLIPEMVRMINTLLRKKIAYIGDDFSVYFSIQKFKKYGELAHLDMKGMKQSVRIDNDEYGKDEASDFALWKAWNKDDGENFWEAHLQIDEKNTIVKGRPGWHIECSACAMKYFGKQIDIHMGGIDNLFPHHQNEVAQTESCTGKTFSKYWIHHGHLTVDGKKMAKSAGNFYTLKDLEDKFSDTEKNILYRAVRLNFLNGKYRSSIDFSFDTLEANINTIKNIDSSVKQLFHYTSDTLGVSKEFNTSMQVFLQEYVIYLEDDFAIPEALAVVHDTLKFMNVGLREKSFSIDEGKSCIDFLKTFDSVLALFDFSLGDTADTVQIPVDILQKLKLRDDAKAEKDFDLADSLRDEISREGYKIIDGKQGSRVEKLRNEQGLNFL